MGFSWVIVYLLCSKLLWTVLVVILVVVFSYLVKSDKSSRLISFVAHEIINLSILISLKLPNV